MPPPAHSAGVVVVTCSQPSSLPTRIPSIDKRWTAAGGIDNLNNYQYWNFHPYPQRSDGAELKFDLCEQRP